MMPDGSQVQGGTIMVGGGKLNKALYKINQTKSACELLEIGSITLFL